MNFRTSHAKMFSSKQQRSSRRKGRWQLGNNHVIKNRTVCLLRRNVYDIKSKDTNHHRLAVRHKTFAILLIAIPLCLFSFGFVSGIDDLTQSIRNSLTPSKDPNDAPDGCDVCKLLVGSFEKGLEKTMRGKHEGGDTSWEERNLKSYADSEVRLVEIQEELCDDVDSKVKAHCFSLAEEAETHVEEWWFKSRRNNIRLHDYLCINKLKKCCPADAFGPTCQPCPASKCHYHGDCDGAGTRGGSGECICQTGYSGNNCEQCQEDFYKVQTSEQDRFSCLECHIACSGGCIGPSSANCTDCKSGYKREPTTNRCIDINECELASHGLSLEVEKLCPDGTYCTNTEGLYKCADCHQACSTCLGYGRNKCIACTADYFMDEDHNCVYVRDPNRFDPNLRQDESLLAYFWRRFQADGVLKIMLNILLYLIFRWVVEKINYGSARMRKVIIFLAMLYFQMEIYPFIQQMIITDFEKNSNYTNNDSISELTKEVPTQGSANEEL